MVTGKVDQLVPIHTYNASTSSLSISKDLLIYSFQKYVLGIDQGDPIPDFTDFKCGKGRFHQNKIRARGLESLHPYVYKLSCGKRYIWLLHIL